LIDFGRIGITWERFIEFDNLRAMRAIEVI